MEQTSKLPIVLSNNSIATMATAMTIEEDKKDDLICLSENSHKSDIEEDN